MILLAGIGSVVCLVAGWLALVWEQFGAALSAFTRKSTDRPGRVERGTGGRERATEERTARPPDSSWKEGIH